MDRLRQSLSTPVGRLGTGVLAVVLAVNIWLLATDPEPQWLVTASFTGLAAGLCLVWSAQYVYERRHWICGALATLAATVAISAVGRVGDIAMLVFVVAIVVAFVPPPQPRAG